MAVVLTDTWHSPRLLEAGVLFDFAVIVPLLYYWCYRAKGKSAMFRALGLSCLGIWLAGYAVPDEHHQLLDSVAILRYLGLGALFILEVKLMLMLYGAMFRDNQSGIEKALKQANLPPWVNRIVAIEVRFWRWVGSIVKRVIGKK